MIAINLQTSFLTPPFGFALFYLRGVAPRECRDERNLPWRDTVRCDPDLALILLAIFPQLATWLPEVVYGR